MDRPAKALCGRHIYRKESQFKTLMQCQVYYTNASILPVKIMRCSKLHCIKVLNGNSVDIKTFATRSSGNAQSFSARMNSPGLFMSSSSSICVWEQPTRLHDPHPRLIKQPSRRYRAPSRFQVQPSTFEAMSSKLPVKQPELCVPA